VAKAQVLAEQQGFTRSCAPEVGRLLRVLAAGARGGVVGEIGSGYGLGAAWMVDALAAASTDGTRGHSGLSFVTVEEDAHRAEAVRNLLAPYPWARVLHDDWHAILAHGPFTLLFADAAPSKEAPDRVIEALAPGGIVVLDDFTPEDRWPPEWRGKPDPVRQLWLPNPRLAATEVLVTHDSAVILATRLS
jgi:predicted O-methyltransferase YrrM